MKSNNGFTMVELMVVVLIVGILAAVAVPLMSGRIDASKWSEGQGRRWARSRSALRAYAAEKGNFTSAPSLSDIGISSNDLDGTYFSSGAYAITSASASSGQVAFVITCTAASSTRSSKPSSPAIHDPHVQRGEQLRDDVRGRQQQLITERRSTRTKHCVVSSAPNAGDRSGQHGNGTRYQRA